MRPAFFEPNMAAPLSSAADAELMITVDVTEDPSRDTGPCSFEGGFSYDNGEEDFGFLKVFMDANDKSPLEVRHCVENKQCLSE